MRTLSHSDRVNKYYAIAATLLFLACRTADDAMPESLIPPELQIRQVGAQPFAARHITGPIPVNFEIAIANRSAETLTLQRIELQSMGMGAYTVQSTAKPFDRKIVSNAIERVELWAPAQMEQTITGANGPVTLRVTVYFNSDLGKFRRIYVQQVNASSLRRPGE